ncbi:MAG: sugar isomerase [Candidatus Brocadiia bacterium]
MAHADECRPAGGCCGCTAHAKGHGGGVSRRGFLGGLSTLALAGCTLRGLSTGMVGATDDEVPPGPEREPLVVKPIFTYGTYKHRHQRSWRPWGGVETQEDADAEMARIRGELEELAAQADFPLTILPLSPARHPNDLGKMSDLDQADTALVYAAAGPSSIFSNLAAQGKDLIFFVRHRSGPVYLWYEIIHPRFLRSHSDQLAQKGMDYQDVVVDSQDEVLWRLRALCGLKNAMGTGIVAVGGASGWSHAGRNAPQLARDHWKLDIQDLPYAELRKLLEAARKDEQAVALARRRAEAYLKDPSLSLETKKEFVERCFLLDQVFRSVMAQAGARAITVNACMGTIMPVSETTACLTLTTLNDDGWMAFCESDFVAIPTGILLSSISGLPPFLHNPTFPHDGIITLAHCTAPRKMDGKALEPARIVTHYESDYGAAPKVEFRKGQEVTIVNADFAEQRWMGLRAEVADTPFLPICRSQLDARVPVDDLELAREMRGFHWMMVYGDYRREVGYALKKTGIAWKPLG